MKLKRKLNRFLLDQDTLNRNGAAHQESKATMADKGKIIVAGEQPEFKPNVVHIPAQNAVPLGIIGPDSTMYIIGGHDRFTDITMKLAAGLAARQEIDPYQIPEMAAKLTGRVMVAASNEAQRIRSEFAELEAKAAAEATTEPSEDKPGFCCLCGEPMPPGEEVFKYHVLSGPCPKPNRKETCHHRSDVGPAICGYTRENHHKADGSPFLHEFTPPVEVAAK